MATKELIRQRLKVSNEPSIRKDHYTVDLIRACNWYNQEFDSKDYKSWFVTHFGKKRVDFSTANVRDSEFRRAGVLCRIKANGNELSEKHEMLIETELDRIRKIAQAYVEPKKDDAPLVKKPTIQDRMDEKVVAFMSEFDGIVDEFVTSGKAPKVDNLVTTMGIAGPMTKKIVEKIKRPYEELQELVNGKDKFLAEGYSNLGRVEQRKLLAIYQSLMDRLQQAKVTAVRKTRKTKVKPAGVIVQRMKYMKESTELCLTSAAPASVVGASEVWVFNTKYRKLQCYFATEGTGISVKGTTLINYDVAKSVQRGVRKPEQVQVLNGVGKRLYQQFFRGLKSTEGKCNGRMSEHCIIMATFK